MNVNALVDESLKLAKSCVYLSLQPTEESPIGWIKSKIPGKSRFDWLYIQGKTLVQTSVVESDLLILFDQNYSKYGSYRIASVSDVNLQDGIPLYAHKGVSMAPIDAIIRFGSVSVVNWLKSLNLYIEQWGYSDGNNIIDDFIQIWVDKHPFYNNKLERDVVSIIGGWHFFWPEGDWEELISQDFILWTVQSDEPWIEIWHEPTSKHLYIKERIT